MENSADSCEEFLDKCLKTEIRYSKLPVWKGNKVCDKTFAPIRVYESHHTNDNISSKICKVPPIVPLKLSREPGKDLNLFDVDKIEPNTLNRPKYRKEVLEIEKRWSGEFLNNHFKDRNSSESSKSSYIEEAGSISSHDTYFSETNIKESIHDLRQETEDYSEDNVSTIDSTSYFGHPIKSKETNLIDLGNKCTHDNSEYNSDDTIINEELIYKCENKQNFEFRQVLVDESNKSDLVKSDGYASLIKDIIMDSGLSKLKDEKKKKSGLRRLLPGLFSPKDSRKEFKREHREKKKRDERHFHQHQQNGIYTRSPDTLHLNEDIKRNVNLDTSLNGTIIEERLNEIKQELFPDQGLITSTPDHFLQADRMHNRDHRSQRFFNNNSSLSSIAIDDKWVDHQNIISGSPDIKKIKHLVLVNGRNCNLERKLSFQESQPRFIRNNGPSGRISAPPSERYLIRPRAVHPMDRPLPAIPQKIEFCNYENQEEMCAYSGRCMPNKSMNCQQIGYYTVDPNYTRPGDLYQNNNHGEINGNTNLNSNLSILSVSSQKNEFVTNLHKQQMKYDQNKQEKYSPSPSQKSGDYADSSYTPNSSQKSEFSPGSSKSGEYYLHSPKSSSRVSPDENLNDRIDQIDHITHNQSHVSLEQIPVQVKDDRIYDETPRSLIEPERYATGQRIINQNMSQDVSHLQRGSPNIPLSVNLAKFRANVEDSSQSIKKLEEENGQSSLTSSNNIFVESYSSPLSSIEKKSMSQTCENTSSEVTVASPVISTPSPPSCIYSSPINKTKSETPVNSKQLSILSPKTNQNRAQNQISYIPSRKAQPSDQILIVSPKRELFCNTQHSPTSTEGGCPDSPVPIADSPCNEQNPRLNTIQNLNRTKSPNSEIYQHVPPHPFQDDSHEEPSGLYNCLSNKTDSQSSEKKIQKSEPLYSKNLSPEKLLTLPQITSELLYEQSNKQSPSKKQTRQNLQAYYWQQKALEMNKTDVNPSTSNQTQEPSVREAIYWQQLKKLNEEQQKKLFERNQFDEKNNNENAQLNRISPVHLTVRTVVKRSPSPLIKFNSPSEAAEVNQSASFDTVYWKSKQQPVNSNLKNNGNLSSKPPISAQLKVQNQPVLVVRPQQAVRDSTQIQYNDNYSSRDQLKCSSLSPSFVRTDERRSLQLIRKPIMVSNDGLCDSNSNVRKTMTPPIYDESDVEKKQPPPIFKRGSLISNSSSSVEYGSLGPKRVSFSNQANSPEIGSGNWPTKYGMAPEPPTRQHKIEEKNQTYNSDYENGHHHLNNIYGNVEATIHNQKDYDYDANRPLPPPPKDMGLLKKNDISKYANKYQDKSEVNSLKSQGNLRGSTGVNRSESSSNTGKIQNVHLPHHEEEWNAGGKGRQNNDTGGSGRVEGEGGSNEHPGRRGGVLGSGRSGGSSGGGGRSRDEPRRHTLSGDHGPSLHHQQFNAQQLHPLHPHHLPPPHGQYGTPQNRHTTMDLEMGTKSRQRKAPFPRGYPPPSSTMLFDDDPGIMSEVETSSTGFRRGGKQRSSLPVVRTPSKTLERPLGLVFLQYRKETKRALLPNEITSIDTVKALFVRSFPKQLTMEYLDSPEVKIYIHDSNKDMFYELEDHRSHLRDIRDRSVLRLIEKNDGLGGMSGPLGAPIGGPHGLPPHWEDQSYFSEPEFDSEFQHQHIHKSKTAKNSSSGNYYMGGSSTLPRGGPIMRAYSPAASAILAGPNATPTQPKTLGTPDRLHGESGYMSSPERGGGGSGRYPAGPYSTGSSYEEPYYSQYSGTVTPVIDEEARIRVEHMERQLANLTGLVQKALTHAPHTSPSPRDYLQVPPGRDPYARSADKSVSFEKSVSFSDEPPDMNSPKQHSPQHAADTKPTKPAIKSSTLPRMSSQERDRHKPTPPPKPVALGPSQYVYRDLALTPEMYNHLRGLQKKAKDLRQEVRNLRRLSQAQAHTVRESIRDTFITIRATLLSGGDMVWTAGDAEKIRLSREEDLYKQEMIRLEKDLTELESTVEELRGNVINRKTRVNMSDVENMALILSKSSKTVADLKVRFPNLQEGMKGLLSSEMEKVVREEKFLKEEPERLESALRRCKKLTGTLVTLKRLASVQEQRLPNAVSLDSEETPPITPSSQSKTTAPVPAERTVVGSTGVIGGGSYAVESSTPHQQRPENALDALLDELQTFSRPSSQLSQVSNTSQPPINHIPNMLEIGRSASQIVQSTGRAPNISDIGRKGSIDSSSSLAIITPGSASNTLRRLHSYPSSSDTDTSPPIARIQVSDGTIPPQKPPVPERNAELLQLATARRVPPPPPPRTSSRSPLASPTSPQLPPRNPTGTLRRGRSNAKDTGKPPMALPPNANNVTTNTISSSSSSSNTNNNINSINNNHSALKNVDEQTKLLSVNNILSTSNSSSCESINSQEGMQSKKDRQEQLEQRHQELLRKQKALQEQYTRLQQLQRNTSGLTTVPPAPPDLLKKTGSESNILAKMGLGMSAANSGSLTSLASKNNNEQTNTEDSLSSNNNPPVVNSQIISSTTASNSSATATSTSTPAGATGSNTNNITISSNLSSSTVTTTTTTTTNKIYETDIL